MSSGQFLLTVGVALLVFDSKKLPSLIVNVAQLFATLRRFYQEGVAKFEHVLEQAVLEKKLEQNQKKARDYEQISE